MGAFSATAVTIVTPVVLMTLVGVAALLRARRAPASRWMRTKGTVLSSSVQVGAGGPSPSESPLVYYSYQVNGQLFQGHRVRVRQRPGTASSIIARYPAGTSVVVFYDPADPANSALEL